MSYREGHHYIASKANYSDYAGVDFSKISKDELVQLWLETLQKGMHGICFSMYEDGQEPGDIITEAQVERRIQILKPYTKWIRSFSCIEGNEHVARVAHKHGIKTLVGAWLSDDKEANETEIEALIQLAGEGCVDIAAVGNEVLYRNELNEEELLSYIRRVKEALPDIPVGYVDAYYEFTNHPRITETCDVILSNCYPYWEGCPIEYSLNHMQQMYGQATAAAQGKKVIITETGWPSEGGSLRGAFSSAENAMKYFINTQLWSAKAGVEVFYFSSFDESWKTGDEGDVGAYWGLWDKHEKLKF
ncbi:glycoside hydrolase family 17 protein [Poritiphilus flavus]|uniref:Endo-1,3-beta-glucanase btgC n=1 Tax=Poritiphilus flavus TaxID=2697053 RepID=A0A6L9E9R4_9FLAO|nr:glycosyl hydrolase family 17 protein [Poritiphilus flavus]NAS11470.1 glycosyl hydrolase [Poritiphilus flavus]